MATTPGAPMIVRWTQRLEDAAALDGPVQALDGPVRTAFGSGTRGAVLRGDWLGHALHPVLTDVVLGSWLSASVLDLTGRGRWSAPARTLVGTGIVAFGPTAWSGWAQWSTAGPREKRVGLVHAVVNAVRSAPMPRRGSPGVAVATTAEPGWRSWARPCPASEVISGDT